MKKFDQKSLKTSNNFHIKRNSKAIASLIQNKNGILENLFSSENNTFYSNFKNMEIIPNLKESKKSFSQTKDFAKLTNRQRKSIKNENSISASAAEQINNIFCINLQNNYNNINNGNNNSNLNVNESVFSRKQIEEKEFNGKRSFQKEIMKQIFTKESGDIIDFLKNNNKNLRYESKLEINNILSNNQKNCENKKIGTNKKIKTDEGDLTDFQIISKKFKKDLIIEKENKAAGTPPKKFDVEFSNAIYSRNNLSNKNSLHSVFITGKSNTIVDIPDEFTRNASDVEFFKSPDFKEKHFINNDINSNHNDDLINSNKSFKISNFNGYGQNSLKDSKLPNANCKSFSEKMILQEKLEKLSFQKLKLEYKQNQNFNKITEKEKRINDLNEFNKAANFKLKSKSPNPNPNDNPNQINFSNTGYMRNNLKFFNVSDIGRDSFYLTQNPIVFGKKRESEKLKKVRSESENKSNMFYNNSKRNISFYHDKSSSKPIKNTNNNNDSIYEKKKLDLVEKILTQKNNKYYCPNCAHCNVISDENLEKHFNLNEAKNIIKKSLDYIVNYYDTDQTYMNFILQNNSGKAENENNNKENHKNYKPNYKNSIIKNSSHNPLEQNNINNNLNINNNEYENLKNSNKSTKFDIEVLLNTYPKSSNNRGTLQVVLHFLDALVNEKTSLDVIAGPETFDKLKDILIMQGITFNEKDGEMNFDQELELMFDCETKEKLIKLFKSKFKNPIYFFIYVNLIKYISFYNWKKKF